MGRADLPLLFFFFFLLPSSPFFMVKVRAGGRGRFPPFLLSSPEFRMLVQKETPPPLLFPFPPFQSQTEREEMELLSFFFFFPPSLFSREIYKMRMRPNSSPPPFSLFPGGKEMESIVSYPLFSPSPPFFFFFFLFLFPLRSISGGPGGTTQEVVRKDEEEPGAVFALVLSPPFFFFLFFPPFPPISWQPARVPHGGEMEGTKKSGPLTLSLPPLPPLPPGVIE